ncbi:hypothetical protein FHX48_001372 [Microbacterium halimionae]|uniref:SCP2 domain-containing protein n=1 Tax=Microbacterium halimionae TaxID=1526413 RepID=A0A7W3PLW5_9MICO|nr:hypothetical protein [Microbacterium halimionae]MBA8816299.1 hypothetical protein [Microbacterium halimionae]NII96502.1 hypothetical protein [Microbacterium halimionae]
MLTETDEKVLAAINMHAVFGTLPRLVELVPAAKSLVGELSGPVTLDLSIVGGTHSRLIFTPEGIRQGGDALGTRARLYFRSPSHLNAVVAGTSQPLPVAGPRGLRFLTGVFTPLTALLSKYLEPNTEDLAAADFFEASSLLTLNVAANAITIVANDDRSGRFSAAQMSDGELDIEVGNSLRYRISVEAHRLTLVTPAESPARAVFGFADLATAGDVIAGRESALACVCDGRIAMRGYIPLVDNTNRILDRVGQYLGK